MDENDLLLKVKLSKDLNGLEQTLNIRMKTVIVYTDVVKVFDIDLSVHHLLLFH
jgi:hypothetical protein